MASVVLKAGGERLRFTHYCFTEKSFTLHKYAVWNQYVFGYETRMVLIWNQDGQLEGWEWGETTNGGGRGGGVKEVVVNYDSSVRGVAWGSTNGNTRWQEMAVENPQGTY
jgi:hypothetical protein